MLIGCDWGTTSFRLRLFDNITEEVFGEIVTGMGIAAMQTAWHNHQEDDKWTNKIDFYCEYLAKQIAQLSSGHLSLQHVPVIVSGMASSTIGMDDVPYALLPFAIDGSDAATRHLYSKPGFPHEIILISGVKSEDDVMRGEETQLVGIVGSLKKSGIKLNDAVLIFPGTHSKHIRIKNEMMTGFKTFMTGELFKVISHHTILKSSLRITEGSKLLAADVKAFKLGVRMAKKGSALNSLFTVRTNQLFKKLSENENSHYLSGLLIGDELRYLLEDETLSLILCSASNLSTQYTMAFEELALEKEQQLSPPI